MTLTAERLRDLLDYDPATGIFTWKIDRNQLAKAGDRAGYKRHDGYLMVNICGKVHLGHRLVWLHVHGVWPADMIDHINGVPGDNRIANLRPATRSQNMMNMAPLARSTSGHKGVSWAKRASKWEAHITVARRKISLGHHQKIDDAIAARAEAEARHFGRFAHNAALRAVARLADRT